MHDVEQLGEPMPPELEARLRPMARTYKAGGRGYATARYVEVVRRVAETGESRQHIERDFPNVTPGHVAQVLRKQAGEHGLNVAVLKDEAHGVCAIAARDSLVHEVEPGEGEEPDTDVE